MMTNSVTSLLRKILKKTVASLLLVSIMGGLLGCSSGGGNTGNAKATLVSIAITPTNPSIAKDTTQQFLATGTFSDSTTQNLTATVTWSSSDTTKATIATAGLATGIYVGSSTIRAASGNIFGTATLTVTDATLVSIAVSPANPSISTGSTQQFAAIGTFSDITTQDITALVTWSSGTTTVATVNAVGLATGVAAGTTTVTATSGVLSGNTTLTVIVSSVPQASDAEIESLATDMRSTFGVDNVTAVSKALGYAGITVYADDMSQPFAAAPKLKSQARGITGYAGSRMLRAQARGMAMELSTGSGFSGSLLNTMTSPLPLEDGTLVPVSQLLAAYIAHGDTYGAKQSRALMPGLDPAKHLEAVFPTLTIVFFMKEFVVPLLAAAQAPAAVGMAPVVRVPVRAVDPCGAVSDFLDNLDSSVSDAVQGLIDPGHSSSFLGLVSSVLGSIVQLGADGVKSLIRHAPFVDALRNVANILGGLTDMQSLFSQWTVNITPPGQLHKIPGTPNAGEFALTMDNGGDGFEWPQAVTSCADLFDISLPQLDSADGSTVTWNKVSGFDDLGIMTSSSTGVIAGNKASCSVTSATESEELHNGGGPVDTGPLAVRADVQMPGVEQLATRIGSLFGSLGQGAASVATTVAPHIGPSAPGVTQVEYHKPGSATADVEGPLMKLHAYSCGGLYGVWTGTFTEDAPELGETLNTVTWQFDSGNTAVVSYSNTYSVDCTVITATRTWSLVLSGAPDSPKIDGDINAAQSTYTYAVDGSACDPPGGGAVTLSDQHLGIAPIILGPTAECPAQ